jgi:outer membrane protein assembly factor BamB
MEKGDEIGFTHFLTADMEEKRPTLAKAVPGGLFIEKNGVERMLAFKKTAQNRDVADLGQEEAEFDFFSNLEHEGMADIISFDMDENGYAAGNLAGGITVFKKQGETDWKVKVENPVFALCLDDGFLYAGIGTDRVSCYKKGYRMWSVKIERIPTMFPWWELESQRVTRLAVSDGLILAGCGDNHVRCFNREGDELWTYYFRAAVPHRILPFDIDGDGENEFIISGGLLSAYSQIEIIDASGRLKYRPTPEIGAGWTSITTSMIAFERNGGRFIVQGTNRNNNLVLLKYDGNAFSREFVKSLAGSVTALCESGGTIYAGTSEGFLFAFDMKGERKWLSSLYEGIRYIEKTDSGLFVIQSEGTMCRLGHDGKVKTLSMDSMRALSVESLEDRLMMTHEKGIYSVMKEAEDYEP